MSERRTDLGGLNVGDIPAFAPKEEEESPYERLEEEALGDLEQRLKSTSWQEDLSPPKKDLLPMPEDPTTLGTRLFGYYDNALEHWRFVATTAAALDSRALVLKERLDYIRASLKKAGKDTSEIETDKEYVRCNVQLVKVKAEILLIEPTKSFLHKRMQQLSRLVEGIKMEIELGGRQGRLGRAPRGSSGGLPTPV